MTSFISRTFRSGDLTVEQTDAGPRVSTKRGAAVVLSDPEDVAALVSILTDSSAAQDALPSV